jgi:hypothetical protein
VSTVETILTVLAIVAGGFAASRTPPWSTLCHTCGVPAGALLGLLTRTGPRCTDCGLPGR